MKPPTIKAQIKEVDEELSILRESWIDAKEPRKTKVSKMIDEKLDARLELMKARDEAKKKTKA